MIASIMKKMLTNEQERIHDLNHLMKVWTYAKTIGELEHIPEEDQFILEISAIVHDIACPALCRRCGKADGKMQEIEGGPMTREFLAEFDLTEKQLERVVYLVSHHHTLDNVDGIDYQILLEADYIVNAEENNYRPEVIADRYDHLFKTSTGKALLKGIFCL